jgi:Leucine-rich repeat (LRR) protein
MQDTTEPAPAVDDQEVEKLLSLRQAPTREPVDLYALTKLDLPGCNLSSLPCSLSEALPNLSILFLSNNDFVEMPAIIGSCKKLQMVAFKANKLQSIHPEALQCQMRWLILTDNLLEKIPDTIGRCAKLQKCMLSGNLLKELPEAIANCTNLELIRLSSNQLEKVSEYHGVQTFLSCCILHNTNMIS